MVLRSNYIHIIFIVFLVCSFNFSLNAQCKIEGKVIDANNSPMEFVEVILLSQDSVPLMSELTSELGEFEINTICGEFSILIIQIGSKLFEKKINVVDVYKFGDIVVEPTILLEEVVVSTQKKVFERKIDRLVFNIETSSISAGGTVLDALKLTPGVVVQNDNISVIGKSSMSVLINGRLSQLSGEDLANFLKSIPSDDIKSIEVITTPPAKYGAQGNSGLINIVYKTGRNNYWSNSVRLSYLQTTYPAVSLGNTFNYSKNKFTSSVSLAVKTGDEAVIEESTVFYPSSKWTSATDRKDKQDYISGNINLDYAFSENTSIGAQILGNISDPDIVDDNIINFAQSSENKTLNSNGVNDASKDIKSVNLHLNHTIDTLGKYFDINFDYFNFNKGQDRIFNSFNSSDSIINNNTSQQKIENYSANIDFVHPTSFLNLGYGLKYSHTFNQSEVKFFNFEENNWTLDNLLSDNFEYKESNIAAYLEGDKQISDKFRVKVGLRYENTATEGYSIVYNLRNENNYYKFFPTVQMQYVKNEIHSFALSYSKRISRPAFWELNPFRWYSNQFSYSEGNPFLNPSFADNIEITHAYKNKLITNLFLSKSTNGFSQYPAVDATTQEQVFSRANFYDTYNTGTSITYIFANYDWWQSYNQLYLYYSHSEFDKDILNINPENGAGAYLGSNNSFVLNQANTVNGELSLWYQSKNKSILYDISDSYSVDLGIKVFALKRKIVLGLSVTDIFKTSAPRFTTQTNNILQEYYTNYDSRYLNVSVSYSFGNDKISSRETKIGNEEEKARLGN